MTKTTGTNGTAVTWYVDTRKHILPRVAVTNVFWGDSTGTPTATLYTPRFPAGVAYAKVSGKRNRHTAITNNGEGLKVRISGDKDTVVQQCKLTLEKISDARHL